MNDRRAREICEHIDRLVSVDYHTRRFIIELYNATRKHSGNVPLTYAAAASLFEKLAAHSIVIFLTGFPTHGGFTAEQDGPVGASILARVLAEMLQVRSIVLTDDSQFAMVKECFKGCGFSPSDKAGEEQQVVIRGIKENTVIDGDGLLDEIAPSAVIAIERPSKNIYGQYTSMKGIDISLKVARLDDIIEIARKKGILTIGIGDGGNEAGCGLIRKEVMKFHPNGRRIASCVKTDKLVFSSVSNFGAYGIAGGLAAISGDIYALPSRETLVLTMMSAARAGLHNGPPKWLDPGSDGITSDLEGFVWESIKRMVWEEINPHFPKFY